MITDEFVWECFEKAGDEAQRWRVVGMRGVKGVMAIRDQLSLADVEAGPPTAVSESIAVEQPLRFTDEQQAGEYIQWRMIKAVLEHLEAEKKLVQVLTLD